MGNTDINHHCTCISINSVGIMIEGKSGSGKSSLALGMLDAARLRKTEFSFICDDQAIIKVDDHQLWASVPHELKGLVEIRGAGITEIEHVDRCRIDLVCELIDQNEIIRHPEKSKCIRFGVELNHVQVPIQHEAQSIRILLQKLRLPM